MLVEGGASQPNWNEAGVWQTLHALLLAANTTGGNRSDVTQLIPLLETVPPVPDHPAHRPARHRARLRPGRPPLGCGRSTLVSVSSATMVP